ncbi:MAG: spore germination protein [Oscillospiraceae bacterium]|nr:spore germination protein [Oscillospiraceae bacterium]
MDQYTPRPDPMYPGELSDANICNIFRDAGDFVHRKIQCGPWSLYLYSIDGLVSGGDISDYVLKPICQNLEARTLSELYQQALNGVIYNAVADRCENLDTVAVKLVNGFCVLLFPGVGAVAYEVKTGEKRGLSAPEVENTLKGPKDAFVETVRSNTSLIRRHLRSPDLRIYETQVGRRSLTNVSVVWLKGITSPDLVEKMKARLDTIDIDGFLFPSAVEEYVTGSRTTAFPLLQYTERTDRFCQGILDGRIGLLVDGMPLGYLAPVNIGYLMDSPEDRSRDYISASCVRVLRYAALLTSLLLPAIYTVLVGYFPKWIPDILENVILNGRQDVPFSAGGEVLALLIAYELLQESGIHLPQAIGQSVSTIGGIVVGTAAVEAGLISPVVLIIVSIAGVCGFVLPNRDLANAVRVWRFIISLLGAVTGIWGAAAGVIGLLIRLACMKSMGNAYLSVSTGTGSGILRNKLKNMKQRNAALHPEDKRNQK